MLARETRPDRRKTLVFCYQGPTRRYRAVIKIAKGGHELWFSTMHRTRPRQTKTLLKEAVIIRRHR
jgi:hypothetical protein